MTEEELLALVSSEMETAMGRPDGELGAERAELWRYFQSEPYGDEIEGQSQFVTSEVADAIDGTLPSLLRIFTTADNLVEFEPEGQEDTEAARQESEFIHWVFFTQNPSYEILHTWFFDAEAQFNGYVKAFWDDREIVTTENYEGLTREEFDALVADDELEIVEQSKRQGTVIQSVPTEQGVVQLPVEAEVFDVTFRRTSKDGQVSIENVPPEEMRISADTKGLDLSRSRLVGQERDVPRSELIEMGFDRDVVEDLPAAGGANDSEEEIARYDRGSEEQDQPFRDASQDLVEVQEVYVRVDFDDDGRAELRKVFVAGGKVLENEEVDRQPFHVLCPMPLPHKHIGRCPAQRSQTIQRLSSTLHRQVLDNLYYSNNPEKAVWEQAMGENTLDDLLTTRVGSIKRFSRPVNESFAAMTVPFTAGSTFPYFELLERMKATRTGVTTDGEGLSADALKNIQTSVMAQALDLKRMKIEYQARTFAETGIRSLFLHIHELVQKHQHKERVVLLRNRWVQVNPAEWRTRRNMKVKIGLGIGTREQNLLHLNAIWEKQREMVEGGGLGLTVMPKNLFNTAAEMVRNANLMDPEMFFTDPGDGMPQPQQSESERVAQLQAQLAQLQAQVQAREQDIDRERNMMQHARELEKIQIQRQEMENKLFVEMEEIRNALTKLELEQGQNVPGSRV